MARPGRPKGLPKTGGGSRKGVPNKATVEIKLLAREYGPQALKRLAELGGLVPGVSPAESEQAQVTANREILDRGYGKATQSVELGVANELESLLDRITSS